MTEMTKCFPPLRRSRVIGDSFSEFRHIESRKSKVCIALLAHDKDVCVVGELSVLCIIHTYMCTYWYIYGPVGVRVGKSGVGL